MYGVLFLLVSLCLVYGHDELEIVKRYTDLDMKEMPAQVSHLIKRSEGHFCCKNEPIDILTKSRKESLLKTEKTKVKVGTESCGVFGLGKCSKYDYTYKQVTVYRFVYYVEPAPGQCKGQALTCCNGYFFIKKYQKCVLLSELDDIIKQLEEEKKKAEAAF